MSFNIASTFEEWAKIFDSKEEELKHSEFNIISLFRRFIKDDPKKVICIHQTPDGNIQNQFKQIVNGLKIAKLISQP